MVMFSSFFPLSGRIRSVWPTSNALIAFWICVGSLGSMMMFHVRVQGRELFAVAIAALVLPKSLPSEMLFNPIVSW